jgi:hypothetical protein
MKQKIFLIYFLCLAFYQIQLEAVECLTNSSGIPICAAQIFNPTTLADIQAAIAQARLNNVNLRFVGGLHSGPGDVTVPLTGYLANMNGLNKILEINPSAMTIKVQGGINLYQLSHELAKVGLALLDQPGPYDDTAGGMAANAVHESGLHGCLCDSIIEIQIVDANGNLQTISDISHPDWFPAARVSLGVLGAIYSVTFQCVPTTNRHVVATVTTTDAILPQINQLLHTNDNYQFLIDPASQTALSETFNITNQQTNVAAKLFNFSKYMAQSQASGLLSAITTPFTPVDLYPIIDKAIVAGSATNNINFFYKGYSYFHANTVSRARIAELCVEAQFLAPALEDLFALVQQNISEGNNFILTGEVRYVSDKVFSYLSPTNRPSWCIGLILIFPNDTPAATQILLDFTNMMQNKYNGRPQWGNNPEFLTYPETLILYGAQNVNAFNAVRRIFDPTGVFYTPYFQQILGPL